MKRKRRPQAAQAGDGAEEKEEEKEADTSPATGAAASTAASSSAAATGAGKKAKRKPPAQAKLQENVEAKEDDDDEEDSRDLDVIFDFCDPNELDYHSVRDLLKSGTWEFVDLNFSEMADAVVGQGNIGTLIKSVSSTASAGSASDVDETVCALFTALNIRQFPEQSWPKAISDALVSKARKHAESGVADQLQALLERRGGKTEVGLLLSERFVNLPMDLLPPFHKALTDDVEWSCTTPDCPEEERPFYRFTHFVGLARCHVDQGAAAEAASAGPAASSGKKKKRRKGAGAAGSEETAGQGASGLEGLAFVRPEDEVYVRRASFCFSFPMPTSSAPKKAGGGGVVDRRPEKRVVFALTKQALWQAVADIPEALAALE